MDNGSLFILSKSATDFFMPASGLTFFVKDYDGLSKNETVGKVSILQEDLLKLTGERIEYNLVSTGDKLKVRSRLKPKLTLRVRKADEADFKFMKQLHSVKKSKKTAVYLDETFVAPKSSSFGLLKRETKKGDNGITLVRCSSLQSHL